MKTSKWLALVLALSWIAVSNGILQAAPPQYRYYTTGQGPGAEALAINDNGQAVVNFNDRAFLWSLKGGFSDLGDLGGGKSYGYAINNLGQIVGESYINSTTSHAFLWQSGQMLDLGGLTGGVKNIAVSINNLGQAVGGTIYSNSTMAPFIWTQTNGLQPLDLQGGFAAKIKDDGRMVGSKNGHAWLWEAPGAGQDLGTLPAPYNGEAEAHDINQNGQVVGFARQPNNPNDSASHAFSWTPSGGLKDLGTLDNTPGYSRAFSINNQGYIVGWSYSSHGTVGCLWTPTGDKLNLDTLVVNKPSGVTIGDANGINTKGVIVGAWVPGETASPYMLVPPVANFPSLFLLLQ